MKKVLPYLIIATAMLFTVSAIAADRVVVIPLGGSASTDKLWGKGRPGTELLTHTDPNGYCTASSGIHYALSATMSTWYTVAEVCPAGTWVCTENDFPDIGLCPIQTVLGYQRRLCDGSTDSAYDNQDSLEGWISDLKSSPENSSTKGTFNNNWSGHRSICYFYRVWCCWK